MIQLENKNKSYGQGVLKGIDLLIQDQDADGYPGPSGSGNQSLKRYQARKGRWGHTLRPHDTDLSPNSRMLTHGLRRVKIAFISSSISIAESNG